MRENNWKTNGFLDGYRRQAKFEMINFSQKADIFDKIHPGFLMSNLSEQCSISRSFLDIRITSYFMSGACYYYAKTHHKHLQ